MRKIALFAIVFARTTKSKDQVTLHSSYITLEASLIDSSQSYFHSLACLRMKQKISKSSLRFKFIFLSTSKTDVKASAT